MTDKTGWVLDLRGMDSLDENSPDGLRLTNATALGEANGYTIHAQRRSKNGVKGLCIKLTAPDGRTANLVSFLTPTDSSASAPISGALSAAIAVAFSATSKPDQVDLCATRIEAVITAAHECLNTGLSGTPARVVIQSTALGINPAVVRDWRTRMVSLTGTEVNALEPARIVTLIEHGFTPDTAHHWFSDRPHARMYRPSTSEVKRAAVYRDAGWTRDEMDSMAAKWYPEPLELGWSKITPIQADIGLCAGLKAREAVRMIARGEWDETALRMLAALRGVRIDMDLIHH